MDGEKLGQRTQRPVVSGVPAVPPGKGSPLDGFSDDTLVEVELGAMREIATMIRDHQERLDKLGSVRPATGKGAIDRVLADDAAGRGDTDTEHLLMLLRANGVTRYKRSAAGDVEIELQPGAEIPVRELIKAWSPAQAPGDIDPAPGEGSPLPLDDVEPNGTEGALEEELSPLPPFSDLRQQSEDLRRQQEADRSGVEVTEADDG